MRSSASEIYHLYFQPKEEYIVKIKSYMDFFDICPWSSVRLCNDMDFSNMGGIKAQLIDTNGTGYFEGCFLILTIMSSEIGMRMIRLMVGKASCFLI